MSTYFHTFTHVKYVQLNLQKLSMHRRAETEEEINQREGIGSCTGRYRGITDNNKMPQIDSKSEIIMAIIETHSFQSYRKGNQLNM